MVSKAGKREILLVLPSRLPATSQKLLAIFPATLAELKATDSWKQDTFIAKGGWATFPGMEAPNNNVAEACAKMLNALK